MVTSLTGAVSVARAPTASEICRRPLIRRAWSLFSSTVPPLGTSASPRLTTPTMRLPSGNLDGVLGEAVHVDRARHQQRFLDLLSSHLLRMDYEVDPKHLPGERLSHLVVVGVMYTRHGARDALGLRRQTRDDVHFV